MMDTRRKVDLRKAGHLVGLLLSLAVIGLLRIDGAHPGRPSRTGSPSGPATRATPAGSPRRPPAREPVEECHPVINPYKVHLRRAGRLLGLLLSLAVVGLLYSMVLTRGGILP
ncbi:hypothetical protein M2160_001392 [Streptomyces sp. SAI-117]|uniref:hypothetical protein n=1 Tax=unclassified Streptomyces TaxID=2593676 RepID=UPI0024742042|nr:MULTISPECIES: hypothetical protein [unclassified Streptomyces]MDH6547290.1 hypothetical protein [Streptomyces sp. SAI-041]MDH6566371.1 hypothetical protein [Streptomyces sp. SAI-117]MDH6588690.1 hypothetical protein [Streptomyces sp. SAI-133]